MRATQGAQRVQVTLRLPRRLYEQIKKEAAGQRDSARSWNEFVVQVLRGFLRGRRRKAIDAAFAGMAQDAARSEAERLAAEFAASDWEALETGEKL